MSKNVKKAPGNGVRFGSASSVCHFLPCERDFGEPPEDAGNALVCLLLLYQERFLLGLRSGKLHAKARERLPGDGTYLCLCGSA